MQITGSLVVSNGVGNNNIDPDRGNVAFGKNNTIGDNYLSFAHGIGNTAFQSYTHAEGSGSTAKAIFSHAEGFNTIANGYASHTEGLTSRTDGSYSHAEGTHTSASGQSAHAEGYYTIASGNRSHAEGNMTKASGLGSHSEGFKATASGEYSHAEGSGLATGDQSHAEGGGLAAGNYSHAEGFLVTASGNYSHAEGFETEAGISGVNSYAHAEGNRTVARGNYSHAAGNYTIASGSGQNVVGDYNLHGNTTSLFVIGDGTSEERSDLLRAETGNLQVTGSTKMTGSLDVTGTFTSVANNTGTYGFRMYNSGSAGDGQSRYGLFLKAGNTDIATAQYPFNIHTEQGDTALFVRCSSTEQLGHVFIQGSTSIGYTQYSQVKIGNTGAITEFTGPTEAKSYTILDGSQSGIGVRINNIRGSIGTGNSERLRICDVVHSSYNIGDLGIVQASTRKAKKNFIPFTMSADFKSNFLNLQTVNFQWKGDNSGEYDYGLIAEETSELVPDITKYGPDYTYDDETGQRIQISGSYVTSSNDIVPGGVVYEYIPLYLLEVIKDQQKEINDLASRIAALE